MFSLHIFISEKKNTPTNYLLVSYWNIKLLIITSARKGNTLKSVTAYHCEAYPTNLFRKHTFCFPFCFSFKPLHTFFSGKVYIYNVFNWKLNLSPQVYSTVNFIPHNSNESTKLLAYETITCSTQCCHADTDTNSPSLQNPTCNEK